MNKLSSVLSSKIGKKSQYDKIVEATYDEQNSNGNDSNENAAMLSGISRSSSSNNDMQERRSVCNYLKQNIATVIIVVLLTIIFALAGERASIAVSSSSELVENKLQTTEIKWRPCQLYLDPKVRSVKVLQTSLADPANQWGQVPCLVRNSQQIYDEPQWNWLFGNSSAETQPLEYGMPSATIKANFKDISHPKRKPIMGFGGAFTEASALNYMTLEKSGREAVMELLFGKNGLGYSLGRVPMNSCDFSPKSYSFDDHVDDFELKNFDVQVEHDVMSGMIEFLLQANQKLKDAWPGDKLNVMTSPWSPPAWMKKPTLRDAEGSVHSASMTGSVEPNCLREGTGPDSRYAAAWALYFSKFLTACKYKYILLLYPDICSMKKNASNTFNPVLINISYPDKSWGIDLFAVTVQNEPEFPAPWEACAYDPPNEAAFIANHLGPVLKRDHPDVKLLMFDHNKDHAVRWANEILGGGNPAAEFVDGTAVHWYAGGMDRLLDGAVGQPNMHRLVSTLSDLNAKDDHMIFGSEACHCPSTGYAGGNINVAWDRAERYAHTILADLAAGSNGWVEWNLL